MKQELVTTGENYMNVTDSSMGNETVTQVKMQGELSFGKGHYGDKLPPDELDQFCDAINEYRRTPTVWNTADCGDSRKTVGLADGTADPAKLRERVVRKLFGGMTLAVTDALVIAGAVVVADAEDMTDAYEKTDETLGGLEAEDGQPYEDGGHAACGKSAKLVETFRDRLPLDQLVATMSAVMDLTEADKRMVAENDARQQALLDKRFFRNWSAAWHEKRLREKVPHNFAELEVRDDGVNGHHGVVLLLEDDPNAVLAKNALIEATGKQAYATTLGLMERLANQFGTTAEERRRILLAFVADSLNTANVLFAPGMPVAK